MTQESWSKLSTIVLWLNQVATDSTIPVDDRELINDTASVLDGIRCSTHDGGNNK